MPRRHQTYGFIEVVWDEPLTLDDAAFAKRKREQGVPDVEIAKMLGCTVPTLQKGIIVDDGFASASDPAAVARDAELARARRTELAERNRIARQMTTWRADAPNPLARAASLPHDLPRSKQRDKD